MSGDPTKITIDWDNLTTNNTTNASSNPLITSCTESYDPLISQGTFTINSNENEK